MDIRFSQMKMRHLFGDGRRIAEAIQAIRQVPCTEEESAAHAGAKWRLEFPFPPIEVVRWRCKLRDNTGRPRLDPDTGEELYDSEENWFTLDNRRLYCLQEAWSVTMSWFLPLSSFVVRSSFVLSSTLLPSSLRPLLAPPPPRPGWLESAPPQICAGCAAAESAASGAAELVKAAPSALQLARLAPSQDLVAEPALARGRGALTGL
ncbi:unnamed protein product [Prorocentrum cordatum]|nr:unnamed protein product [Polarella glacialis]